MLAGLHSLKLDRKKVVQKKRSDGRLKLYDSCSDERAWTLDKYERQHYIRDLIAAPHETTTKDSNEKYSRKKSLQSSILNSLLSCTDDHDNELHKEIRELSNQLDKCREVLHSVLDGHSFNCEDISKECEIWEDSYNNDIGCKSLTQKPKTIRNYEWDGQTISDDNSSLPVTDNCDDQFVYDFQECQICSLFGDTESAENMVYQDILDDRFPYSFCDQFGMKSKTEICPADIENILDKHGIQQTKYESKFLPITQEKSSSTIQSIHQRECFPNVKEIYSKNFSSPYSKSTIQSNPASYAHTSKSKTTSIKNFLPVRKEDDVIQTPSDYMSNKMKNCHYFQSENNSQYLYNEPLNSNYQQKYIPTREEQYKNKYSIPYEFHNKMNFPFNPSTFESPHSYIERVRKKYKFDLYPPNSPCKQSRITSGTYFPSVKEEGCMQPSPTDYQNSNATRNYCCNSLDNQPNYLYNECFCSNKQAKCFPTNRTINTQKYIQPNVPETVPSYSYFRQNNYRKNTGLKTQRAGLPNVNYMPKYTPTQNTSINRRIFPTAAYGLPKYKPTGCYSRNEATFKPSAIKNKPQQQIRPINSKLQYCPLNQISFTPFACPPNRLPETHQINRRRNYTAHETYW